MFKPNICVVLNSQRPDKNNLYPVRIRTTIKRKVSYYPTGIMLRKDQLVKGEVVKHPNKVLLNTSLRSQVTAIEKSLLEQSISGEEPTKARKVVNPTFKEFAEKLIKDQTGVLSPGRIEQKYVYLRKFLRFAPHQKLKDISKDTMIKFENFCRGQGNNENTVHSNTTFLKSVLNAAFTDGYFTRNPAQGFRGAKYKDPLRIVLTPAEIKKFEGFADNPKYSKPLRDVAAWFIFSVYTGLRYGDLNSFKGFVNGKVLLKTGKTDETVSIFATKKIIQAKKRLTTPAISNQKMNDYLKIICVALKIEKRVTCHLGRHTMAVEFLNRGGDIFVLSKILGHTSLKTTQIYANLSNFRADAEMKRVWDNG